MNRSELKNRVKTHTNGKDLETIRKGTRALHRVMLKAMTKNQLIDIIMSAWDEESQGKDEDWFVNQTTDDQMSLMYPGTIGGDSD